MRLVNGPRGLSLARSLTHTRDTGHTLFTASSSEESVVLGNVEFTGEGRRQKYVGSIRFGRDRFEEILFASIV